MSDSKGTKQPQRSKHSSPTIPAPKDYELSAFEQSLNDEIAALGKDCGHARIRNIEALMTRARWGAD